MSKPTPEQVAAVASEHSGAHPYTIALLIQAQHGCMVTGQEVARVLRTATGKPAPVQIGTKGLG